MDIGIKIVTCDVGVSPHSKTHRLFMKYSKWDKHTVLYIPVSELVSCAFSTIPTYTYTSKCL